MKSTVQIRCLHTVCCCHAYHNNLVSQAWKSQCNIRTACCRITQFPPPFTPVSSLFAIESLTHASIWPVNSQVGTHRSTPTPTNYFPTSHLTSPPIWIQYSSLCRFALLSLRSTDILFMEVAMMITKVILLHEWHGSFVTRERCYSCWGRKYNSV